jgi:hypothetical protein
VVQDKIAKIPESVDLENLQDYFADANTMPTTPAPETERKQDRDTTWVFIEMLCVFLTVSDVNMKLTDGRAKKERLAHYNKAFEYQVESKWEDKEWVDQHGVAEDKKTPAQSIQERVHHIKTDTQETVISFMHDTITKLARNVWLTYFEYKKKLRPNKYGQTERDSEKEGVEQGKPAGSTRQSSTSVRSVPLQVDHKVWSFLSITIRSPPHEPSVSTSCKIRRTGGSIGVH